MDWENSKSFEDVAWQLSPEYSGYFLADATTIFIQEKKQQLLFTTDVETQDISYAALSNKEDCPSWQMVLQGLKDRIGYPAKRVVADGDPGLLRAVRQRFPGMPI